MAELQRTVGLLEATVYGVGLILGAGIYAVIGEAVALTGESIVLSFLLAAAIATLTGLSYAELASRFPVGEAEYRYAWSAFRSRGLAQTTALLRILTGVVSAAAVALAFGGYLSALVDLPAVPVALALVGATSLVNAWGIRQSTRVNLVFTAIEVGGILLIVALGVGTWQSVEVTELPRGSAGVLDAAFLVFFAYLGFESLVNLAEEIEAPSRTIPRAIVAAIAGSTLLYLGVGLSAVGLVDWQVLGASPAPLATVARVAMGEGAYTLLAAIALFATSNTVLVLLLSTSRLVYGVSKTEYRAFPTVLARVHPRRQTPHVAVGAVGLLALPFVLLGDLGLVAELANLAFLVVFVVVNASLIRLRRRPAEGEEGFRVPLTVGRVPIPAVLGLLASLGLIGYYLSHFVG
jgi:APA family basic amino acid/polyamine antiporter